MGTVRNDGALGYLNAVLSKQVSVAATESLVDVIILSDVDHLMSTML